MSAVQILIRRIQRDRKGNEELFEDSVEGSSLSLGHLSDQSLQLLDPEVAPRHAVLRVGRGGSIELRCLGAARVLSNGRAVAKARLGPGQSVQIGQQALTVVAPPPGFAAAIELLQQESDAVAGPATHFVLDLEQAGLRSRPLALALLVLIPLLFLAFPLAGYFDPVVRDALREQPLLPSDAVWSSGPLANAHHSPDIGRDCNACHLKAFEPTPDRACLACHEHVNEHFDQQRLHSPRLGEMGCAACHKEHNEPANLVRHDSALCVDCHADLETTTESHGGATLAQPVRGFSPTAHPEFRYGLLRFDEAQWSWSTVRERADAPALRETSNLRFPHDLHLDPQFVRAQGSDEALGCADCHRLGADGERFFPVTMESHCRSCHSLAFDEEEPARQLPHADVPWAVLTIEEHFLRRFVDPSLRVEAPGRRRPGRADDYQPRTVAPLEEARQRAALEAHNQFTRSGCVTCHEVTEHPARPLRERWRVKPVRIASDWFPQSRFDHAVHLTPGAAGPDADRACLGCHAADASGESGDILVPGIENCLGCHGDTRAPGVVQLDCTGCHVFHQSFGSPLKTQAGTQDAGYLPYPLGGGADEDADEGELP